MFVCECVCIYVCVLWGVVPEVPEEGNMASGVGVILSCMPPRGYWETNSGKYS